jgi:hypothetical protein
MHSDDSTSNNLAKNSKKINRADSGDGKRKERKRRFDFRVVGDPEWTAAGKRQTKQKSKSGDEKVTRKETS